MNKAKDRMRRPTVNIPLSNPKQFSKSPYPTSYTEKMRKKSQYGNKSYDF